MSIRAKLTLAFAGVILIILAQGAIDYWRSSRTTAVLLENLRDATGEHDAVNGMLDAAFELEGLVDAPSAFRTPNRERIAMLIDSFASDLDAARQSTGRSKESATVRAEPEAMEQETQDLWLLDQVGREFATFVSMWESRAATGGLRQQLDQKVEPPLLDYRKRSMLELSSGADIAAASVVKSNRSNAATLVMALAGALLAWVVLARVLVKPLRELARVSGRIADGDRKCRLNIGRSDEFGDVERNFNRMVDALDHANRSRAGLESEARGLENDLERFFALSVELLCVATLEGKFVRLSASYERVLGWPLEELMERPFIEFVHPDDQKPTIAAMRCLQDGFPVTQHVNRYRHANGSWVTLSWTAAPAPDAGFIYAVARDITAEQKSRELDLLEDERRLRHEHALEKLRNVTVESVEEFCRIATEESSTAMEVDRVAVWFFDPAGTKIECIDLFVAGKDSHDSGLCIESTEYPQYFDAVQKVEAIVAGDVRSNPQTRELLTTFLEPAGITSMLDVPVRSGERVEGIVCFEHTGPARVWDAEEIRFATSVAGSVMLAIETERRRNNEMELRRLNATLEQRVAERTLQLADQERRFRQVVEQVQDYAILVLDPEGAISTWNAGAARLKGYSAEDIIGKHFSIFYLPEDRKAGLPATLLKEARERGRAQREGWRVRKDGTRFWADVVLTANRDSNGRLLGFIKITRDLTERRHRESELRESEQQFRSAMENSAIGMALVAPDGRWLRVNRALCEIVGYTADELAGMNFQMVTYPEDLESDLDSVRMLLAGEIETYALEKRYVHKTGFLVWVNLSVSLVRDEMGEPKYFISQIQDITDSKNAEIALRRALEQEKKLVHEAQAGERAKSEFLAVMSHEVRTPMNGILGFADLLVNCPDLSDEARDYAETIARSGTSLLRILDDILDLSRLEAGRLQIELAPFSIHELLRDIVTLLSARARTSGIAFTFEVDDALRRQYHGDAGRIRQVLLNLAGNSLKFTDQGAVALAARRSPRLGAGWIEFTVRDTGCGIPAARLEHIFEPFVQADSSTSRQHGGAGLGLAISRRLVLLMEGHLSVSSREGEGTEFIVEIPLQDATPPDEGEEARNGDSTLDESFGTTHPLRILVAEDDRVNRKLIVAMLRKLGYDSLAAEDGAAAVSVFETERPDCVIMDIQMPGMDGIEATERIRQFETETGGRRSFVLALTANTSPRDRERCLAAGMNAYLNKPVKRDQLVAALMQAAESGN